jgi:tyrosinase
MGTNDATATDPSLQARIDALLQPDVEARDVTGTSVDAPFSPFIPAHAERAAEIASHLFQVADDEGLAQAVTAAEQSARDESSRGLVKRAVKTFVTHHDEARRRLTLPSVELLESRAVAVGEQAPPPGTVDEATLPSRTLPLVERGLDWYREDPFANDHHAHWHDVWVTDGIVKHDGRLVTQARQGELFLYMHQQMLARYDTERTIAGLPQAVAFAPAYDEVIPEGYGAPDYVTRPADVRLRRVAVAPGVVVGPHDLDARYVKLDQALRAGRLTVPAINLGPLDQNQLGAAIEPSDLNLGPDRDLSLAANGGYQNLHGLGHVLTAQSVDPQPADQWWGVMYYTETAIRDPFFYRWHRHIDDLSARLQERGPAADLSEHAATGVSFRDGGAQDLLLAFSDEVPDADFDAFPGARLGGEAFDDPDRRATDTLTTRFVLSHVTAPVPQHEKTDPVERTYWTTHLTHRPFGLFLRVEASAAQHVTVRVFLAHAALASDRRMWIELDKFDHQLAAGVNLIGRPDALSSVIKRKGVDAPGAAPPPAAGGDAWCDCGWPYSLLLPSGASSEQGTPFKLAVVLTDWESDHAGEPGSCGSMSYCGSRQRYPDLREMGYPFDRPFPGGVLETLAAQPNVALRDLTIRCENERPPA